MPFPKLKFTLLGTGTSQGVPVIGCNCPVCTSSNPRDNRLRSSAMVSFGDKNVVIDTGPDFRQQMLREGVDDVTAILFTHEHNDHTAGLDDVRPFNFKHQKHMTLYATPSVQKSLAKRYAYAFGENSYPGAPRLIFKTISKEANFEIDGLTIQPIEVQHGANFPILGFRFGDLTYITDCKFIDELELEKIKGSKYLILNALHHDEHYSHLSLKEAVVLAERLKAQQTYFTHLSHNMGKFEDINTILPPNMALAYDGLIIHY